MSNEKIFVNLSADEPENTVTEIESLCMSCYKQGTTRLLLTKIPFYKEVIICSFSCDYCGYSNNEIQSGSEINEKGVRYKLTVENEEDLNRQVIKSDHTSIKIVELDFEVPSLTQKGEITTVEGIINRSIYGLEQDQSERQIHQPEIAEKISEFIERLKGLKDLKESFTIILEDISGNTFVENPKVPNADPNCVFQKFTRTSDQNSKLCVYEPEPNLKKQSDTILEDLSQEVLQFKTNCSNCGSECETNMKMTKIPYFKEVVIMATVCEKCGHRTNEVKSGCGIEPKGVRIELFINEKMDFSRDVLKSETCRVYLKDLDIDVGAAAISGRFTTVEGLLTAIYDQLHNQNLMFSDSQDQKIKDRMSNILERLQRVINGEESTMLILDDPAGNSYVQSLSDSNHLDNLKVIKYDRNFEQNDELGLNDMNVDNYS